MINYFYNIILKTDDCDLYSDVLTGIRKDYYLSHEKQKGKITQNSSGDTLFYEFAIEKDRNLKWQISDSENILSDTKHLDSGCSCINYYGENGLYKAITFSKFHTLLKVEYFNLVKANTPYCVIEPRKSGNDLCLLLTSVSATTKPSILYAMPDIEDDYIQDKVDLEFSDYTVLASTNEGVVKFLSESQLDLFEEFVDRATAMKLTDMAPESYIDEKDAVLASKLNPKDFNVKRNLSEIIDISQAQEFSYDNIEEELLSDMDLELFSEDVEDTPVEENVSCGNEDISANNEELIAYENASPINADSVEVTETVAEETVLTFEADYYNSDDTSETDAVATEERPVTETVGVTESETEEADDSFDISSLDEPTSIIQSLSSKYLYYGDVDLNGKRSGFGRTATEDGRTAYEGQYLNNKREGLGAYYYKDSGLCYYGEWKNNKRNGLGIGVSSVDKSIHIGNFTDNKPDVDGVRVKNNGEIEFVKKTLANGMTVELRFDNDKIIVSKYNENGELISENTSNLIYF